MWLLSDCRLLDSGQEGRGSQCFFFCQKGPTLCLGSIGVFIGAGVECWGRLSGDGMGGGLTG